MKSLIYMCWLIVLGLNASAGTLVRFQTGYGALDVELFDQDKPVTVQNFLRYVNSGYYQNMFLHRCVPGFVMQGGGFLIGNPSLTSAFHPTNGNIFIVPTFAPITNEFSVGHRLTNSFGTIAMAKQDGNPNSATSQWFFNLGDNSENLDTQNGGFTVFGRVIRGTDLLNFVNSWDKAFAHHVVDLRWWLSGTDSFANLFSDLPVPYDGTYYPRYADLIYASISVLIQVQVQTLPNQTRQISWNTLANQTNYVVEFTTNLPPALATNFWRTLATTNGIASSLKVIDPITNSPSRFYRVRANY